MTRRKMNKITRIHFRYPSVGAWLFMMAALLCFFQSSAQEVPEIININREEFKGGNRNWDFAEDKDRNLYIANSEAILIFNGLNWQKVFLPNHRTPRCLFQGPDGKVYAGGFETIGYVDRSNPSHPVFVDIGKQLLQGTEEEIWHISGSGSKVVFQSFAVMIIMEDGKLEKDYLGSNIMFGDWINGQFYVPRIDGGIYHLTNDSVELIPTPAIPVSAVVTGLVGFQQNKILISTLSHGIYVMDENKVFPFENAFTQKLKLSQVNKILQLSDGRYIVGTIQNGVFLTKDFQSEIYHANKSNGLNNNTVLSLYEFRNGPVCIGLDIGFNIWKVNNPELFYYDLDGHLGNIFSSIYYRNKFFVATNQGIFIRNEQGQFEIVPGSQGIAWSFILAGNDLLCGHNTGTLQWKDGRFIKISNVTGGLHQQLIDSTHILQSTYTGLLLLEKKNNTWQIAHRVEGSDKLVDRFIYQDGVVVGLHPYFGLVYYELSAGMKNVTSRRTFPEMESFIGSDQLGLFTFENKILIKASDKIFEISKDTGLIEIPENLKEKIETYYGNRLAYLTLKPLNTSVENTRIIAYFPERNEVIRNMDEGYTIEPLSNPGKTPTKTVLKIDYVLVNDSNAVPVAETLRLNPGNNNLLIQLRYPGGFSGSVPPTRYRLQNFEDAWNDLDRSGRITYKQLRHGRYRLEIQSGDLPAYTILSFTILPHWYESWTGWMLYGAIVILILALIQHQNRRRLNRQREKLHHEKEVALEAERMKAKSEKLENELTYKSKMLADSAMTIVQKNEMLNDLKKLIQHESTVSDSVKSLRNKTIKVIDRNLNNEEPHKIFENNFAEVHHEFFERLKAAYPEINPGDLKLAAFIRMNMSSKEIAPLLQISIRSVENKRYRLRKKMNLEASVNLSDYLMRF